MKPTSRRSGSNERHSRSKSAMQRPARDGVRSDFSGYNRNSNSKNLVTFNANGARSIGGTSRHYEGPAASAYEQSSHTCHKRLGGPTVANVNIMHNVTREQREIRFFRENESALLNRLGPGPAKYQCYNKGSSVRHTYSIPRVSPH